MTNRGVRSWLTMVLIFWAATTAAQDSAEEISTVGDGLRLNHERLNAIYVALHDIALGLAEETERQLDTIQKIYSFVAAADRIGFHQWELLGLRDMVCPERREEFDRLRARGLQRAARESRDTIDLLRLYDAFLQDESVRRLTDEAIGLIEGNIYLFERLRGILHF